MDAVNLSIMLRALKDFWISFDGIDSLPSARQRECDGIASDAGKAIDQDGLFRRRRVGHMFSCLPSGFVNRVVKNSWGGRTLLCYRLGGNAIPCVVSHQNALIVSGKNAEPLMIIANSGQRRAL